MRNQDKFPNGRNRDDNILTKRSIGHSGTHIYCYVHTAQTEAKWKKNEIQESNDFFLKIQKFLTNQNENRMVQL